MGSSTGQNADGCDWGCVCGGGQRFLCNAAMVITNKWIFQRYHFNFPMTVRCRVDWPAREGRGCAWRACCFAVLRPLDLWTFSLTGCICTDWALDGGGWGVGWGEQLTCVHMLFCFVGAYIMLYVLKLQEPIHISWGQIIRSIAPLWYRPAIDGGQSLC